jgi:thioredoxin 2
MNIIKISCPHCLAINRIPENRLGDNPDCGRCKGKLFEGKPIDLDDANIPFIIGGSEIPVVVDCWAEWCGPCKSFAPVFEQAAAEMEPEIRFARLNTELHQDLGAKWNIRSIPTLILFRNGKEANRVSGALPAQQLRQWLEQAIS